MSQNTATLTQSSLNTDHKFINDVISKTQRFDNSTLAKMMKESRENYITQPLLIEYCTHLTYIDQTHLIDQVQAMDINDVLTINEIQQLLKILNIKQENLPEHIFNKEQFNQSNTELVLHIFRTIIQLQDIQQKSINEININKQNFLKAKLQTFKLNIIDAYSNFSYYRNIYIKFYQYILNKISNLQVKQLKDNLKLLEQSQSISIDDSIMKQQQVQITKRSVQQFGAFHQWHILKDIKKNQFAYQEALIMMKQQLCLQYIEQQVKQYQSLESDVEKTIQQFQDKFYQNDIICNIMNIDVEQITQFMQDKVIKSDFTQLAVVQKLQKQQNVEKALSCFNDFEEGW